MNSPAVDTLLHRLPAGIRDQIKHLVFAMHVDSSATAYLEYIHEITFPEYSGIDVNMMPVKVEIANADVVLHKRSFPKCIAGYMGIIDQCLNATRIAYSETGDEALVPSVIYVTVMETEVIAGQTQRRPGLHVDRHAGISLHSDVLYRELIEDFYWGGGKVFRPCDESDIDITPVHGIFIANNAQDSCQLFPCIVNDPHFLTDEHGGIDDEYKIGLPVPVKLKANTLYWITDRTPHEALPLAKKQKRQFFRLVVGPISHWFAQHNTPSPTGVQPACPVVHCVPLDRRAGQCTVHFNKFEQACCLIS